MSKGAGNVDTKANVKVPHTTRRGRYVGQSEGEQALCRAARGEGGRGGCQQKCGGISDRVAISLFRAGTVSDFYPS